MSRVLFVVLALPIAEIYLLVQLGHLIGGWATLAVLIGEAALGSALFKRAGLRTWRALRESARAGQVPGPELADGALTWAGAALLIVPGLITDVLGLLCVFPLTRPLVRRVVLARLGRRLRHGVIETSAGATGFVVDGHVVDGHVVDGHVQPIIPPRDIG